MKILAFEFSSPQRSVAVLREGLEGGSFAGSEVLQTSVRTGSGLAMVESALRESGVEREEIECLAVGLGPGSYTGVRAAISLAQGWQLASGSGDRVGLLGVSSVECLAVQAQSEGLAGRVNLVVDAQRQEFYLAVYDLSASGCREVKPLRLATLAEMRQLERDGEVLAGPEAGRWFPGARLVFPRAAALARLALKRKDFVPGERLEPIYLREARFVKAPPPRVVP